MAETLTTGTIEQLAAIINWDTQARLIAKGTSPEIAAQDAVRVHPGRVYTKIDVGTGGRWMVENATGTIYGIKGYGKVHKGHRYGTLATAAEWYWGAYYPHPATPAELATRPEVIPPVDTTPPDPGHPVFGVGDGATVHIGTDATAWTVIAVSASGKTITMQEDTATLDPDWRPEQYPGGFAAHTANNQSQKYTYTPNPDGQGRTARLNRKGWVTSDGFPVSAGRRYFYDYNF